jgi:hypothetical protein
VKGRDNCREEVAPPRPGPSRTVQPKRRYNGVGAGWFLVTYTLRESRTLSGCFALSPPCGLGAQWSTSAPLWIAFTFPPTPLDGSPWWP